MKRLLIILCICFASDRVGYSPERKELYIIKDEPIIFLDWHDIDMLFKKYQIKYPMIVKAQVKLETGYLKSTLSQTNYNLFGMRYAPRRTTTAYGELYGHALYESYEKSIEDYAIWQGLYYKGGDYYSFLLRVGYAQDKNYINKLKSVLR